MQVNEKLLAYQHYSKWTGKGSRKFKSCSGGKEKQTVYPEKDKQEIAKYATICGITAVIRKFQPKLPNLTESTVCPWVKSHKKSMQKQKKKEETSV